MKLPIVILLALHLASPAAFAAGNSQKRAERNIEKVLTQLSIAWRAGDREAWADAFAEDAYFTVWFELDGKGNEQLAWHHQLIFDAFYADTAFDIDVRQIRFVRPDVGEVRLAGKRIDDLPASIRDELRNRVFGFVFQFYHLLPELTLLENVLCPLMIRHSTREYWKRKREFKMQAKEMIKMVSLDHRLNHKPAELSGGEMQRAAIARALVGQPDVLLADEPTGNLDSSTGGEILDLLRRLNADQGLTIIMVTHDEAVAAQAQRIVWLTEGRMQALEEAA